MGVEFIISDGVAAEGESLIDAQASSVETQELGDEYNVSAEKMLTDNLMILAFLFFIFYFMLIRPQQRRVKAHQKMVSGLEKGKKVITSGGIIGTITKFEGDDVVVVEIAPDVKVRIARSSVSDVIDASDKKTANDN